MFPREINCALKSHILYNQTFGLANDNVIPTPLILLEKLYCMKSFTNQFLDINSSITKFWSGFVVVIVVAVAVM